MIKYFCFLKNKEKRLSCNYNKKKSEIIIFFLFLFSYKIFCLSKNYTFYQLLFKIYIILLYIIIIIDLWFRLLILQFLEYILNNIDLLFKNLRK